MDLVPVQRAQQRISRMFRNGYSWCGADKLVKRRDRWLLEGSLMAVAAALVAAFVIAREVL